LQVFCMVSLLSSLALAQDEGDSTETIDTSESETAPSEAAASPAPETPDGALSAAEADTQDEAKISDEGIGLTLQDRIKAVSRKVFIKEGRFELAPFGGISVNDAFYRRWTVGSRASYHIFDSLSIDVGGAVNLFSESLPSVRIVGGALGVIPDEATLFGYADIGGTFSPIYGKFSLMSEWIVHFDTFVSGGVGLTVDSNRYTFLGQELPELVPGINPAAQVGFGGRVFLFRWLVLRVDLRDYIYPQYRSNISTLQNLFMLNIGLGFYFPFDFEYKYSAAKVVEG
jgi:outer membrane beta-barrel protein